MTEEEDFTQEPGADCGQCQHPFDPHIMVSLFDDLKAGGVVICPEPGCTCRATWSAGQGVPDLSGWGGLEKACAIVRADLVP